MPLSPAARRTLGFSAVALGLAAPIVAACVNPTRGPDVIVAILNGVGNGYTSSSGVDGFQAYSVGTDSLNIGSNDLEWIANTNHHPVIGQNLYRFKSDTERPAGRLEMVGMSWLKHGFTALALGGFCNNSCTFEPGHGSGNYLGMGCRDPYDTGLNGSQTRLGPRGQVNAFTGDYPFDSTHPAGTAPAAINKRLQVLDTDVDPALNTDAKYFVEGQYVSSDDALAGNGLNNASYRPVTVNASRDFSFVSNAVNRCSYADSTQGTYCTQPAIYAWAEIDPDVQILPIDVPGEGRFHVAQKVISNGEGTWWYEYALHNLNSDRSAQAFSVTFTEATNITAVGSHQVPHHSGDCLRVDPPNPGNPNQCGLEIDDAPWTSSVDAPTATVSWSTDTFATNPAANALRWSSMFNFWFQADRPPTALGLKITLFKPGTPETVDFTIPLFNDDFEVGSTIEWSSEQP